MNKMPIKQIYLLIVIIIGILALTVYSTYALFTFESETSEVFNIQLPSALTIKTNLSEYKQIEIPKKTIRTTDIDLYNTYDYSLCYSIWYKVLDEEQSLVNVYEINEKSLNSSGTIAANNNQRFKLLITNDSEKTVKINIGLAATEASGTCSLELSSDKKNIKNIYDKEIEFLKDNQFKQVDKPIKTEEPGSYIYKNKPVELKYTEGVSLAKTFEIKNNKYILSDITNIKKEEYETKLSTTNYQEEEYYICKTEECLTIYRINEATLKELPKDELEPDVKKYEYIITNVDEYEIYNKGISGLKKVGKNYYYYGSNPNNFIYYNCNLDNNDKCELWRIIGWMYNEKDNNYNLRIIRNDSLGSYQYNENQESNTWTTSSLYKYLNKEYPIQKQLMNNHPHITEEIPNLKILPKDIFQTPVITENKEITLINLTDYLNSSNCENKTISNLGECLENSWLNRPYINSEWTLTSLKEVEPVINETTGNTDTNLENNMPNESTDTNIQPETNLETEENNQTPTIENNQEVAEPEIAPPIIKIEKKMYTIGNKITAEIVTSPKEVRPVVNLTERILYYGGNGTLENPYIIK